MDPETWNALVERHRGKGCDALAAFARALLDGKKSLHGVVGSLVGALLAALGRPRIEQVFARELASRVPLPFGHEIALAARGLQAVGIFICFTDGGAMGDCACLRDLLLNEGKAQLGVKGAQVQILSSRPRVSAGWGRFHRNDGSAFFVRAAGWWSHGGRTPTGLERRPTAGGAGQLAVARPELWPDGQAFCFAVGGARPY
ncbi:hypothetical protein EDD38_0024 [Kitasatospora cineracea]|uniref:Uncharacterized protein n=1 Tax=Kitasatospora cineracea TaxID=88074 RepID=A0A3N4S5Z1_9ACTN|nr:hypothetical protein EDD38_0024 [Kitasatospora cineracea]